MLEAHQHHLDTTADNQVADTFLKNAEKTHNNRLAELKKNMASVQQGQL